MSVAMESINSKKKRSPKFRPPGIRVSQRLLVELGLLGEQKPRQ